MTSFGFVHAIAKPHAYKTKSIKRYVAHDNYDRLLLGELKKRSPAIKSAMGRKAPGHSRKNLKINATRKNFISKEVNKYRKSKRNSRNEYLVSVFKSASGAQGFSFLRLPDSPKGYRIGLDSIKDIYSNGNELTLIWGEGNKFTTKKNMSIAGTDGSFLLMPSDPYLIR